MKLIRNWRIALIELILGLACALMLFRWFEHSQVYHPGRTLAYKVEVLSPPVEDVKFKAKDGTDLRAWFFGARQETPRSKFAVVLCHGNGGNISHRVEVCEALRDLGLNVLSFDYRGYGQSAGRPSENGTYLDAQAAYAWLRGRGFEPGNIIAYGESLGGGVASELSRREVTGGLILQSTFTSIPDIGAEFYPWLPVRLLCRIRYDTLQRLPEITVPVLVMHSREDRVIDFRHAERNFSAARDPKLFCELKGDHNNPLTDSGAFRDGVDQLLALIENPHRSTKSQ